MSEVTLIIDDKEVKAMEGMTLLDAARSVGIDIPTLCYHEKLAPYGACRLCTVEIIRDQRSRLVASCVYPVEDGLIVKTESEPVVNGRKMLLHMMIARCPAVKEVQADVLAIQHNLNSREEVALENGRNLKATFDQLEEEQELLAEKGLDETKLEIETQPEKEED